MDDYKENAYVYDYNFRYVDVFCSTWSFWIIILDTPQRFYKTGDLSKQHRLRANLKCKSFRWFMETIAFDIKDHYSHKYPETLGEGEISIQDHGVCMDFMKGQVDSRIGLSECASKKNASNDEQYIYFNHLNEIRSPFRDVCLDYDPKSGNEMFLKECHGYRGNQEFHYNMETKQFVHRMSGACIDAIPESGFVFMRACHRGSMTQKWNIQYIRKEHLLNAFKPDSYNNWAFKKRNFK